MSSLPPGFQWFFFFFLILTLKAISCVSMTLILVVLVLLCTGGVGCCVVSLFVWCICGTCGIVVVFIVIDGKLS